MNHKLDEWLELRLLQYYDSNEQPYEQWTVICNDLPRFIDHVITERGLEDQEVMLKIGVGGGGGFLKIGLSIFQCLESRERRNKRNSFE